MNNYVLNCKSHFLAMFHGCAAPAGRTAAPCSHFYWTNKSLALESWFEPIRKKSQIDSPSTQAGHASSSHASEVHSSAAAERANEGIKNHLIVRIYRI